MNGCKIKRVYSISNLFAHIHTVYLNEKTKNRNTKKRFKINKYFSTLLNMMLLNNTKLRNTHAELILSPLSTTIVHDFCNISNKITILL